MRRPLIATKSLLILSLVSDVGQLEHAINAY